MASPAPRQPVFNIPPVLVALLGLLIGIHLVRVALPAEIDNQVLAHLAFVPGRLTFWFEPGRVTEQFAGLDPGTLDSPDRSEVARFLLGDGAPQPWTVLTYALLHGSWTHLGLNGIWLLAFGTPVARRFGAGRFLLFLAAGAVVGAATHYALFPLDLGPLIGASAAVSTCMGAALRFIFQPRRPVVPDAPGAPEAEPTAQSPAVPVSRLMRDRRAVTFFIAWFATNLVSGIGSTAMGLSDAPIAWQAHIGGFLFGLVAFWLFDPAHKRFGPEASARAE